MREIGGYFGFEYGNGFDQKLHAGSVALNSGRNCLEYILRACEYKKIFLPYYTCDAVLEPVLNLGLQYEFYHVDKNLEPLHIPVLSKQDAFLYTNYFGLKGGYVKSISSIAHNLIIDNSQALFEQPLKDINTFYSLRKFTGVPDGAFVYCCSQPTGMSIPKATSAGRNNHLFERLDADAETGYPSFIRNEESLKNLPVQSMSNSTSAFVRGYDFGKNKNTRQSNYLYLHKLLSPINKLSVAANPSTGPLAYPLWPENKTEGLKKKLIENKIYIPTYWPNVIEWLDGKETIEKQLTEELICVPVDQRYYAEDMDYIAKTILDLYGKN